MKNKMYVILSIILLLFVALYFVVDYKNNKAVNNSGNPYGKDKLKQETIDQLKDPLYQNQITPDKLEERLANKEDISVYFYSPTCVYCQRTTPVLVPLTEELDVDLLKFNLLEFEGQSNTYGIKSTPTLVHYKDGKEIARISGERTKDEFSAFFEEFVLE